MTAVVGGIRLRVGSHTHRLRLVALLLEGGEDGERHVEHVVLRPYRLAVFERTAIVLAFRCQLERYLILIVVVLVVATQADEHSQLVVLQLGGVLCQGIGMGKHLYALVLAQVEGGVLIHCLRLARIHVLYHETQSLLVVLHELCLRWVLTTSDAWRQDVVDWLLLGILLDTHGTRLQGSAIGSAERLVVGTPGATHEVERTEAHDDRLLEVGEEHAHEADAGEVVDIAHLRLILIHWDAELVPRHGLLVAVRQARGVFSLVHDIVLAHHEVLRAHAHVVLEVLLILIERIVLVDVLHVGR